MESDSPTFGNALKEAYEDLVDGLVYSSITWTGKIDFRALGGPPTRYQVWAEQRKQEARLRNGPKPEYQPPDFFLGEMK